MSHCIELTDAECRVLLFDLAHAPTCPIELDGVRVYVVDNNGAEWTDATMTVPYVHVECACGYFPLLKQAQAKLRAAVGSEV